jgi:histidyl-tRNA synthetase
MSTEKRIYKPKSIAGFPEWLPEERLVEQKWFDHIRRVFESYGFCSIETPSVEELDVLTAKGEVDKEIYVIERLHKDENDKKEARLALHFDQTVPMARYVAMNFNELVFPFKRYQMQRVWRGERPQMGRMREFYQCDIDIINVDNLPVSFDAEVAAVVYEVLEGLNIGRVQIRINNRKILMGLLESMGIVDIIPITRIIDKKEKVGEQDTYADLLKSGLSDKQLETIIELIDIKAHPSEFSGLLRDFIARNDVIAGSVSDAAIQTMHKGIEELAFVLDNLKHLPDHAVVGDLSIVRGLDYYTGTVYETQLLDVPEFTGSVCSGGRYDDLAGSYINKHLPGVGISIGFSRLFDVMLQMRPDLLGIGPKSPAHVMMILPSEDERAHANATARTLREKGYNVEMYHAARKIPDQLKYASKKLIPYVWFPFKDGHQVKNMASGEQTPADPKTWSMK